MNLMISMLCMVQSQFSLLLSSNNRCNNVLLVHSPYNITEEYVPFHYIMQKTLIITNPCDTAKSVLVQNHTVYVFYPGQSQRKRLCVARHIIDQQIPTVSSIVYLKNDLILLIDGILYRTQNIISAIKNTDLIYQVLRYPNVPISFDKINHIFTTPCCACLRNSTDHLTSQDFNELAILADTKGNVNIFHFPSMSVIYNVPNIFQSQSICQSNQCSILYLGLFHAIPMIMCVVKYETKKAMIYYQPIFDYHSSFQNSTIVNFTDDILFVTPTSFPNAYFLWDTKTIYYTPNNGLTLSEVTLNGCQVDYLDHITENDLKIYYKNLEIDYDNISLITKQIFCLNQTTFDYLMILNAEFYVRIDDNHWLYGKESFFPSMTKLPSEIECIPTMSLNISRCLTHIAPELVACSSFVQSSCSYRRFEPLFHIDRIHILEKNSHEEFQFILEAYTIIPIMIVSIESDFFHYSIDYTIGHLENGIIQVKGRMIISTTNQTSDLYGLSLMSFRLGLVQHGYSCTQMPSFSFQVEASCSIDSALRITSDNEYKPWDESNPIIDTEWYPLLINQYEMSHIIPLGFEKIFQKTSSISFLQSTSRSGKMIQFY
ncbi:unnamed protein product [Adineta ricciae]|uniref:Uncharacterized protein n=1 Tax=Adineta ricciae TaxID=249248 RepID=A0A814XBU9_ADIRI|nr:unnamed protein product [Adineta ricciae]CAF1431189.1 unnamed protein product [Adineta ricciae]